MIDNITTYYLLITKTDRDIGHATAVTLRTYVRFVKTSSNLRCSHIPRGIIYSYYGNATPANICRQLGPFQGPVRRRVDPRCCYSICRIFNLSPCLLLVPHFLLRDRPLKGTIGLIVYIEWLDYTAYEARSCLRGIP